MLKAEHITKQYQIPGGGHTVFDAVSDVSIELGDGGVTAIVGESGSGKSTSQSAVLCGAAGRWAGVSGWSGGVRLQKKGTPRCKR